MNRLAVKRFRVWHIADIDGLALAASRGGIMGSAAAGGMGVSALDAP